MKDKLKNSYIFKGDCLGLDIESLSLCKKNKHGKEFNLYVKFGLSVSTEQLKELAKFNDLSMYNEQFWTIELKKCKKETKK